VPPWHANRLCLGISGKLETTGREMLKGETSEGRGTGMSSRAVRTDFKLSVFTHGKSSPEKEPRVRARKFFAERCQTPSLPAPG